MSFGKGRRLDVFLHIEGMTEVVDLLRQIVLKEGQIMAGIDDVITAITAETDVVSSVGIGVDSAIAKLVELRALVAAGGTDPAKLQAALAAIDANTQLLRSNKDRLGTAVDTNT